MISHRRSKTESSISTTRPGGRPRCAARRLFRRRVQQFPRGGEGRAPPPPATIKVGARALGLVDRARAETEARAKISWGDSQEEVTNYLMLPGFTAPEASGLVRVLYKERLAALRAKGVRKTVSGLGLMCVPVIAYLTFAHVGVIPLKLMAIAIMVGLWGYWLLMNGVLIFAAPKMESGDVAE